jgi:hypothetical protein
MNSVTVTLYICPKSLVLFYGLIQELNPAHHEDANIFDAKGIEFTTDSVGSYVEVNVPIKLYFKFKACVDSSK